MEKIKKRSKKKSYKKTYTQQDVEKACSEHDKGTSIRNAAKMYGVPPSTLHEN